MITYYLTLKDNFDPPAYYGTLKNSMGFVYFPPSFVKSRLGYLPKEIEIESNNDWDFKHYNCLIKDRSK